MPDLRSLARVTRRGGSITPTGVTIQRNDVEDSLETKCWLIYTAMMEKARRRLDEGRSWQGRTVDPDGRIVTVDALKAHARDLYPTAVDWSDNLQTITFMKPIYKYLRTTGNAIILARNVDGDTTKTAWSLSPEWSSEPAPAVVSRVNKSVRAERAEKNEKKVTAAEAGEDRAPAPVTVRRAPRKPQEVVVTDDKKKYTDADFAVVEGGFKCPLCEDVRPTRAAARGHFGSKHRQTEKFTPNPKGSSKSRPRSPSTKNVTPNASALSMTTTSAVPSGDSENPYMCPTCGDLFPSNHAYGGHLKKHNSQMIRDRLAAAEAQLAAMTDPTPEVLLQMVKRAMKPHVDPEMLTYKTKYETAQIEVNRLTRKEQDLLQIVADQQERIDKMGKMIAAVTG